MPRTTRLATLIAALACIALVGAGCSEKESGIGAGQEPTEKRPAKTAQAAAPTAAEGKGTPVAKATGTPTIVSPKGPPPTRLQKRDLRVGKGTPVKAGDQAQVNYALALYGSGRPVDNSFERGQPLPLQVGSGTIPGFGQGIVGMRVGGRRQVIVPPSLAYGARATPAVPANSTLIFVIDLLSAGPAAQGGGAAAPTPTP